LGDELGEPPMVLPDGNFFPDRFALDLPSVEKLVRRMQQHAGMADIPIRVSVLDDHQPPQGSSCASGACSIPAVATNGTPRLVDEGESWRLQLLEAELRHPVVLTTNVARSLGYVFLIETKDEHEVLQPPVDITADMTAVALGLGALMLQGSYIYTKSCGGPSVGKVTKMTCPELAVAFAAFISRGGHPVRKALKELDTTQRTLLEEAYALLDSNRAIVQALRNDPSRLVDGDFELVETKPWLTRLFGKKKASHALDDMLDEGADLEDLENMLIEMPPSSRATRSSHPPADPEREELRDLVTEAFQQARAEAK
jgi:hypothetical protein